MTGAMYAAISGLKTHMNKLNVIGNNIANVNTYGYKTQRAIFSDSIYATTRSGSDGTAAVGAINPSQIGYGVEMSSVDLDMSSGTYSPTGRDMDCMIMGDGFFLVSDKTSQAVIDPTNADSLTSMTLTRVGNFDFKADGYLSDGYGNVVYGFLCTGVTKDGVTTFCDQLVPIRLPRVYVDEVTNTVKIGYPSADLNDDGVTYGRLHDFYGPNYDPTATDPDDEGAPKEYPFAGMDSISIDPKTGLITGTSKDTKSVVTIGVIALGNVTNPNGVTHTSGPYYKADKGAGDLQISIMGGYAEDMDICNAVEDGVTMSTATTGFTYINGSMVDQTNADPNDPDNPPLSDDVRIYSAGTTELMTGGLEMSKTDLATEIAEMITTQRGYQANTRIITVTDSMLEELVNIKR